jgi:hypothetical protein
MSNPSELLLNVVSITVPKLLLGIYQKVMRLVVLVKGRDTSSQRSPANRQALTQSCDRQGTW